MDLNRYSFWQDIIMSPNRNQQNNASKPTESKKTKNPTERINTRSTTTAKTSDTPTNSTPKSGVAAKGDTRFGELTIKDLMDEIKDFRKSMEFMSHKYDDLLQKHNLILEENKRIKTQIMQVSETNKQLQTNMNEMFYDVNEIKQNKLKKKLVITGAPVMNNTQELNTLYTNIISKLELPQEEHKITEIFQGKRINATTQSSPIFVELQSKNCKNTLLQVSRIKQLRATDLGLNTNNRIKISEKLTSHNKEVFNEANQLRQHGFKYIWVKNGKIFIRKCHNSEIINIKNRDETENYKQQNITH